MSKGLYLVFLVVLFSLLFPGKSVAGNPKVKYWIAFKDKNGTPFSLTNPGAFLTAKSVARRSTYKIPYHVSDLPLNPAYIKQIDTTKNVDVIYASKWLNGVVISTDSLSAGKALASIKSYSFVKDTGKVFRYYYNPLPEFDYAAAQNEWGANKTSGDYNYGGSRAQNNQLYVDCLHDFGFRGQGMTIAVMDVGFTNVDSSPIFDTLRSNGGILGGRDFVDGGTNVYRGGSHGTGVLSCMAAIKPNVVLGSAPMAKYWLFRTEDGSSETLTEEYNWIRAAEFADSVGVDMITTSLGYYDFDNAVQNHTYATLNGRTAPMSIAANMAARKGIFVLNAAGNEGMSPWKYISVPADADSICTVGAVDTSGKYAPFSSIGPTADNRIKPDLCAVGWGAWICDPNGSCFPANGTSFATPILAGAVACFWQGHRSLSSFQLLDTLKKRASMSSAPDNLKGWGIPKLCSPLPDLDFDFHAGYNEDKSQIILSLVNTNYDYISFEIFDLHGRSFIKQDINKRDFKIYINAGTICEGIYIVKVKTSKGSKTKKFYR